MRETVKCILVLAVPSIEEKKKIILTSLYIRKLRELCMKMVIVDLKPLWPLLAEFVNCKDMVEDVRL